jgi:hypothetical protein
LLNWLARSREHRAHGNGGASRASPVHSNHHKELAMKIKTKVRAGRNCKAI